MRSRHVAVTPPHSLDLRYSGDSALGVVRDSAGTRRLAAHLGGPAFDYSPLSLVLRFLSGGAGTSGMIRTFAVQRGAMELPYVIERSDLRPAAGEPVQLDRVTVDFGRWKFAYWIHLGVHAHFGFDMIAPGQEPRPITRRDAPPA